MKSAGPAVEASPPRPARSRVGRWAREPLLQFLVLGAALFVGYSSLQPESSSDELALRIELKQGDIEQLEAVWIAKWQRPPSTQEMLALVQARVDEEVLYREAIALGLDQGDEIVRRRLAQKMDFLLGDMAAVEPPSTAELKAWYEQHADQFLQEGRLSFHHLYFSPDRRGGFAGAREAAMAAMEQLRSDPAAARLADRFMFQDFYGDRTAAELGNVFGLAFADGLFAVPAGSWQGPLESGLGWHLVWIESLTPPRSPAYEEIEPDIKLAWLAEQRTLAKEAAFLALRARYDVVLPPPPDAAADAGKVAQ